MLLSTSSPVMRRPKGSFTTDMPHVDAFTVYMVPYALHRLGACRNADRQNAECEVEMLNPGMPNSLAKMLTSVVEQQVPTIHVSTCRLVMLTVTADLLIATHSAVIKPNEWQQYSSLLLFCRPN